MLKGEREDRKEVQIGCSRVHATFHIIADKGQQRKQRLRRHYERYVSKLKFDRPEREKG